MKKLTTILIVCLVLIVGTVGVVRAMPNDSLTRVLDKAGETLGTLLYSGMADEQVETVGTASTAGVTQSTKKIAQIAIDVSTTTSATMLNDSGQDRIIMDYSLWYESSQSTVTEGGGAGPSSASVTFDVTTSSDPYTVSATTLLINDGAFSTSTAGVLDPQLIANASTTPSGITGGAVARMWLNGEYLNLNLSATITQGTSTGIFSVGYLVR